MQQMRTRCFRYIIIRMRGLNTQYLMGWANEIEMAKATAKAQAQAQAK